MEALSTALDPRPAERMPGAGRLWFGLLIPAVGWKLQLFANYSLVSYACRHDLSVLLHLVSLTAVLVALVGSWVALGSWRRIPPDDESDGAGIAGRSRFLAISGIVSGGFFALLLLAQWIPNLLLGPCDGIR